MINNKLGYIANSVLWRFDIQIRHARITNIHSTILETLFYRHYHDNFFFVQIGANDGRRGDPIYKLVTRHKLAGLAIEPLPDIFAELRKTYRGYPKVKLANIAIHRTEREVTLYRVPRDANVPDWAHGSASLDPKNIERSSRGAQEIDPSFAGIDPSVIVHEKVPAEPLNRVFEDFGITDFDLFQVDAEGYDEEIVRMLLETKFRPNIISFERLGMSSKSFWDLGRLLMDNRYYFAADEWDAIAWRV